MSASIPDPVPRVAADDPLHRHLPGEPGIWVFIGGDLIIFTLFFIVYAYHQTHAPELYAQSQTRLTQAYGITYTMLMLGSSWFAAAAVQTARRQAWGPARRLLESAMLCGLAFVVLKLFEYTGKIRAGLTPYTNDFFMFFYAFTGIHLLHVLVGLGLLLFVRARMADTARPSDVVQTMEIGASFWHLVDLLWLVLFALLYLVR